MKFTLAVRTLLLLSTLPVSAAFAADLSAPSAKPDPWKPLRVLIGKWEGAVQGEPGNGKATREYAFILNNRFIHITNQSIYPPQEKNQKGEVHDDVGFISYDKATKKLAMRQFHVEGFVNTYRLLPRSGRDKRLVFESEQIENLPGDWKARETYEQISQDEFTETFELASPGKAYEVYGKARLNRVP